MGKWPGVVDKGPQVAEVDPAAAIWTAHVIVRRLDWRPATSFVDRPMTPPHLGLLSIDIAQNVVMPFFEQLGYIAELAV